MNTKGLLLSTLIGFILMFSSCKTATEYIEVPVETVKIEYKTKYDSIYLHDSVNVFTEIKGDTVYINKIKYQLKSTVKTDTLIKIDSIPVVVEIPKTVVVNKLHTWQRALMYIGGVGILVLLIFILCKIKIWKLLF